MSKHPAIDLIESKHLKKNIPELKPGDVVRVHQRIVEAGKEKTQFLLDSRLYLVCHPE
jgi:ribosomal protein L19